MIGQKTLDGKIIDLAKVKQLEIQFERCETHLRELNAALKIIGKLSKREAEDKVYYLTNEYQKLKEAIKLAKCEI